MEKTKILYIYGDDDFGAMIAQDEFNLQQIADDMKIGEKKEISDGIYIKLMEFDKIDPDFLDFLREEMIDYDDSKHTNYIVIN